MRKTAVLFTRMLIIYKKGIIKMLSESIAPKIPLLPDNIMGKEIIHANMIELNAVRDHVKAPVIAISQIQHTIMPIIIVTVKITDITVFLLIFFISVFFLNS